MDEKIIHIILILLVVSYIMMYRSECISKFRQELIYLDWEAYKKLPSFNSMVFDFKRWRWQVRFVPTVNVEFRSIGEVPAAPPAIIGQTIETIIVDESPETLIMTGRVVRAVAGVNEHVQVGDVVRIQMTSSLRETIGRVSRERGGAAGLEFFEVSIVESADAYPFLGVVDEPPSPKAIAWEERWHKKI